MSPAEPAAPPSPLAVEAFALHQAGQLERAEQVYRRCLAADPADINALHLLGVLLLSTGRAAEAVPLLQRGAEALEATGRAAAGHAALYNNLGNALGAAGRGDEAVAAYRRGLDLDPGLAELHANLGLALLVKGDPLAAIGAYETALRLAPDDPDCLCNLGNCYSAAWRDVEAVAAFRRVLDLRPDHSEAAANLARLLAALGRWDEAREASARLADQLARRAALQPDDGALQRRLAEAYVAADRIDLAVPAYGRAARLLPGDPDLPLAIGRLEQERGDLAAAEAAWRTAVALKPDHGEALGLLAGLLLEREAYDEVVAVASRLLALAPDHTGALYVLGAAQLAIESLPEAIAAFSRCLGLRPDFAAAHFKLGLAYLAAGKPAEAIASLTKAARLKSDDPMILQELGNACLQVGWTDKANACFAHALRLRPLVTWPAGGGKAEFAVLLLNAPGAGNTPAEYLVGRANYDAHFLALLPGPLPDPEPLKDRCDVVVNLISDVDKSRDFLPVVAGLVDALGKPVVNHPTRILATDRDTMARRLAGLPGCRVPRVERFSGAELLSPAGKLRLAAFGSPCLVRLAGTHGGNEFEKIADPFALGAFVGRRPEADYYVSDFVDTRSADGLFRKYRLVFVGGAVLPYHLAIADQWKVHHYRTEMDSTPWMQREEEAFLADPGRVFGPAQMAALEAIRDAVGLEFFGIDCGLDASGLVVVFEVNATMLIHGHNRALPYKTPYVARIKQAFDAMLARMARGGEARA